MSLCAVICQINRFRQSMNAIGETFNIFFYYKLGSRLDTICVLLKQINQRKIILSQNALQRGNDFDWLISVVTRRNMKPL